MIWFDVTIEGEIQRERLEFGFKDKEFPKSSDDMCTSQFHNCGGRVIGVLIGMRERVKFESRQRFIFIQLCIVFHA